MWLKDNLEKDNFIFYYLENLKGLEHSKNSGVFLEYFLIDYLNNLKLEKKNPEKWENLGIDFFVEDSLGVQLTVSSKSNKKEKKLEELRKKIKQKEISKSELAKGIGLLQLDSHIFNKIVSGDKNNFIKNFKKLSEKEFLEFKLSLDKIKKTFVLIFKKINYLKNNLDLLPSGIEKIIDLKNNSSEEYQKKVNFWVFNLMKGEKPKKNKNINNNSDITYIYDKQNKNIIFYIYKDKFKGNESDELIYSFKYYFL